MRTILWLHVAGGGLSLLAGFAALSTEKGSRRHRWIGRVFVYSMLTMALTGVSIAAVTGVETSVVMGTLAAYLVFTGFTAVTPFATGGRWISLAGAGVAFTLAVALMDLGRRALASPDGIVEGLPALMAFIFAVVAVLAGLSDIRVLMGPHPRGGRKLARHLWRMCFALFIAAASFFLGQANAIPQPLRNPVLLAVPVITPLLVMAFWAWRTRRQGIARRFSPSRRRLRRRVTMLCEELHRRIAGEDAIPGGSPESRALTTSDEMALPSVRRPARREAPSHRRRFHRRRSPSRKASR